MELIENPVQDYNLDPALEVKESTGPAPESLGQFDLVLINVPRPRDEAHNIGDKHMKFVSEHYLKVAETMIHVPDHYYRRDFLISSKKICALSRHFFVRPESLGKEIVAAMEILKNGNGTLSVNIIEITGIENKDKAENVISVCPPKPEFRISMPPIAADDKEGSNVFFIPDTKQCLKVIPLSKK